MAAGAGDQGAGAVGMGISAPGSVSATIGTSGVVFAATDKPTKDRQGRLHTFCHAVPGLWHVMGVTNGAGLSLRWLSETFSAGDSYDELTEAAPQVPAGSDGLLWAPYLFGERTPHLDPEVRAAFAGITASHTRAHFVRAVLEGVAFSCRTPSRSSRSWAFRSTRIRLGGGGARGPLWRQIQADVYGQPSKCSPPKKAARSALLCWRASAWCVAHRRSRLRSNRSCRGDRSRPKTPPAWTRHTSIPRRMYPALKEIGRA